MAHRQVKTDQKTESTEDKFRVRAPAVSLPKGGGAIRGIGEKFAANPVTGTASMTVPIFTSPGRSGFGPQLSLSYDSGSGNGPFGLGWSLSIPSITRKTDKGLPRYQDSVESDVFILSGAEDLVPVLEEVENKWEPKTIPPRTVGNATYQIRQYCPRIEGLFARIERWTNKDNPVDTFWRSISKENITTWYGKTDQSRIFDPADAIHIFSWLISESCDDKGNAIVYEYAAENDEKIDRTQANERNRVRTANRYLKRIKYGNRTPNRDPNTWQAIDSADLSSDAWMFELVFDYDEGHYAEIDLDPKMPEAEQHRYVAASSRSELPWNSQKRTWPVRPDSFSSYRAGFEVRTYRLCQRVLMFHHFPSERKVGQDCLVRSTDFTYSYEENSKDARNAIYSVLLSVTQSGYKRHNDRYLKRSFPPLEFEYSRVPTPDELATQPIYEVDTANVENLPIGLDGNNYQWVDLDGEGVSGILSEQTDAWYYKRNLSPDRHAPENGGEWTLAKFGPLEVVTTRPATHLAQAQFLDLAGDGKVDVVQMQGPVRGFYERTTDLDWEPFCPFSSAPNVDTRDPNLKFVDLTGDGHADILITEDDVFTWYHSLAEAGFGPSEQVSMALDEEKGPRLVFAEGAQSIYLADLSGDGLTDLVRIRNGEVCYWPNLGYGRFGAKVTMDDAPLFDELDQFDQRRIRLADTDGSGTTDIIYLGRNGAQIYFNQSGNRWSAATELPQFPQIDNLAAIQAIDLLGNGTACLVWSSPLPSAASQPMRYIDLMGRQEPEVRQKPHLLVVTRNNLGAETRVRYAPSTQFYLEDKRNGRPWITRLPFPVHCVERVETYDQISHNRFVTRYAYHHGHFDGEEREFRGFGMVEQWDTAEFASLAASQQFPDGTNIDESSHVPPVRTRTWFHSGAYLGRDRISNFFAGLLDAEDVGEYYREPGLQDPQAKELLLDDTVLPGELTTDEEREACRALKGSMLRQEAYALDGTDKEKIPYTVIEQNFAIRCLQPKADNRYAVFFTHARESINYHYERNPADPRISHTLTLEVDDYGNVLKSATVGCARRKPDPQLEPRDQSKQSQVIVTYTENTFTNTVEEDDAYRSPLASESRTYELTGYKPSGDGGRFAAAEFVNQTVNGPAHVFDTEIEYDDKPSGGRERRLIEDVRTYYRSDDLGASKNDAMALLPLRKLHSMALPGESYKLAFTSRLLTNVYQRVRDNQSPKNLLPDPAAILKGGSGERGGYIDLDNDDRWWIPSGRIFYSKETAHTSAQELAYARAHFFLPHRYRDPFHTPSFSTETVVTFDEYDLLLGETCDAVGNRITIGERNIDPAQPLVRHGQDYRVLQPALVMGANRNRSAAAFDALGMVVGTAVMGKPEDNPRRGDLLDDFDADLTDAVILAHLSDPLGLKSQLADPHAILKHATTRLVYDWFAYHRAKVSANPQPGVVYALARETHDAEPGGPQTKIQHSFSYSDGFGREIQKKIQAEGGPVPKRDAETGLIDTIDGQPTMTADDVSPRWVGSGWTIFNNKGKPVRQYEPFFTDTHRFEFDVRIGVSPVIFYDPVERVVATLHPNHTWEKVVFDPWKQETWDVNDTVKRDPSTDTHVKSFFVNAQGDELLPKAEYSPTWYEQRQGGVLGQPEQNAASASAIHADTPAVAHFDSLGRTFLSIAHNKFKYGDAPASDPPDEEYYSTRVVFDIEGNQREIIDAKDRVVMRYDYDMLGNRIHQASMEAGERWTINDVAGKPLYAWDSRGHEFQTVYDQLRRARESYLREDAGNPLLVERTVYGDSLPNPEADNLRGEVVEVCDQAGVVSTDKYDFKGNLLRSERKLAEGYTSTLDWSGAVLVDLKRTYVSETKYDALNRPIELTMPDKTLLRHGYNEANLLDSVEVNLRGKLSDDGQPVWTLFVTNINYDAKGQRTRIDYGNGATTRYKYDRFTFRLTRLTTTRPASANGLGSQLFKNTATVQDLCYVYDPAGNITQIADKALRPITNSNQQPDAVCDYNYDAVYRLIEASGREHKYQSAFQQNGFKEYYRDYPFVGVSQINDPQALRNYTERYEYDAVGNFEKLTHKASNNDWTREYEYNETSQLESGKFNNRLSKTAVGTTIIEKYRYEGSAGLHGSMTSMSHLPLMEWDYRDQLQATTQQVVTNGGTPETTWYVYDSGGERVRKVTNYEAAAGQKPARKAERIYVGGFEVYREYGVNGGTTMERQTVHVMDDKQRIALVETRIKPSESESLIRYQFGNHLSSTSLELGGQAQTISYEEYYPYGSTSFQASDSLIETAKRYRYTGKETDEESGLYYYRARYYAPWVGRWCSTDPAGLSDGNNLYSYCRNGPVTLSDHSGMAASESLNKAVTQLNNSQNEYLRAARAFRDSMRILNEAKETLVRAAVTANKRLTEIAKDLKAFGDAPRAGEYGQRATEMTMREFDVARKSYESAMQRATIDANRVQRTEAALRKAHAKAERLSLKLGLEPPPLPRLGNLPDSGARGSARAFGGRALSTRVASLVRTTVSAMGSVLRSVAKAAGAVTQLALTLVHVKQSIDDERARNLAAGGTGLTAREQADLRAAWAARHDPRMAAVMETYRIGNPLAFAIDVLTGWNPALAERDWMVNRYIEKHVETQQRRFPEIKRERTYEPAR